MVSLTASLWMKLRVLHSLRINPQLQNTGGFFVAVLEKKAKPGQVVEEVVPDPVEEPIEVEESTEAVVLPTEPIASGYAFSFCR